MDRTTEIEKWDKFILKINRICFGQDFRFYIISKIHYSPSGLTYDVGYDEESDTHYLTLCTKLYGYESTSNNGISSYSDVSDFCYGDYEVSDELEEFAELFFKEHHPEIYNDPKIVFLRRKDIEDEEEES